MGDNLRSKCFKCGSSPRADPDIKLYRFPKPGRTNAQRCELWAKFCFPDGACSSVDFQQKLYAEHRMLCNLHFQTTSFTNFAGKKLNSHAVPNAEQVENQSTLDLIDYSAQPGPSHHLTSPIPGPSRKLMDITNIQQYKVICVPEELVKNIPLDTSKDYAAISEPGPSEIPIKIVFAINNKLQKQNSDSRCINFVILNKTHI